MKDLEKHLKQAIKNINEDRAITSTLLADVIKYLKSSDEAHKEVGLIAAKYVETLQRSNEQLVKVATLIQKQSGDKQKITDVDKEEIYELINSGG